MNATLSLDGIIGPHGECMCDHCQMNNLIDGIVAMKEGNNDQETAPVYQQINE